MNQTFNSEETEAPLEGEALAIINRARRRAAISMLILLMGFMTIAGVVVYRLSTMTSNPGAAFALDSVSVPAGAEVISATAQGGLVTVTYRLEGDTAIRLYDGESGEMVGEIAVVGE